MKKPVFIFLLVFMASVLWAMPPMPGSGHTHDGSIFYDDEEPAALYAPALSSYNSSGSSSAKYPITVSTTGNKTILVILARFTDLDFNSGAATGSETHNKAYYENLLQNGYTLPDGTPGLTMRQYYLQQSRNKLNLSFLVLGPYTADYGYAHYGANYGDIEGNDMQPGHLVYEMLNKAKPAAESSGANLDNCTVIVIHAGAGEEESTSNENMIWSHRNSLTKRKDTEKKFYPYTTISPVVVASKTFDDYNIVPEYNTWNNTYEATVGVFCHEFGHILGLPDSYDESRATSGVGQWSLMGSGSWGSVGRAGEPAGSDPAPLLAWERLALGWIEEEQITKDKTYTFSDINNEDKVYTIKLADNQFLLLEGKAKNMTGTGMCVLENGLLITQMHKEILSNYWLPKNRINYGSYRPHGIMVVEAVASNYKANGLGNLWKSGITDNWFTTTALFRNSTLTSVGPYSGTKKSGLTWLPLFIDTIIASGVVIGILAAWYAGRRKLCAIIAVTATAVCISMGCTVYSGESGDVVYDTGPNTNYYTTTYEVHSKTGISGVTIDNIKCNENGSGSFRFKKN